MDTTIYKILTTEQWAQLQADGESTGAPIDLADGYIHFSTKTQVQETADKHFKGQEGLILVAMNTNTIGNKLKWEPSRGGDLFPHLYSNLSMHSVQWAKPISLENGTHKLPDMD